MKIVCTEPHKTCVKDDFNSITWCLLMWPVTKHPGFRCQNLEITFYEYKRAKLDVGIIILSPIYCSYV